MTRRFFDQVDDELRGLVGPALRTYAAFKTSRLLKVWYEDLAVHFEAQRVSGRWAPAGRPVIEVGLHLEAASPEANDSVLERLRAGRSRWRRALPRAEAAPAFGPRSADWRRLSEVIETPGGSGDDPDLAGEVAERLAAYVLALRPLLGAAPIPRGGRAAAGPGPIRRR